MCLLWLVFLCVSVNGQFVRNCPKKGQDILTTNQDTANILGMMDFHSDNLHVFEFHISRFMDFQMPRYDLPSQVEQSQYNTLLCQATIGLSSFLSHFLH